MLGMAPTNAFAQCDSFATSVDESISTTARLHATTTQQGCSGRTTIVIGWISGVTFSCQTGTAWFGKCRDTNDTTNANVTVQTQGCGGYDGRSDHTYQDATGLHTIELGRSTAVNAGSCGGGGGDPCFENKDFCPDSPIVIALAKGANYKLTSPEMGVL